eukprot:6235607-Pyramimonas_sp.AAC.1
MSAVAICPGIGTEGVLKGAGAMGRSSISARVPWGDMSIRGETMVKRSASSSMARGCDRRTA